MCRKKCSACVEYNNMQPDVSYFSVTTTIKCSSQIFNAWKNFIGEFQWCDDIDLYVCSKNFSQSDIIKASKIRLVNSAVPSISRDSESSDCEQIGVLTKEKAKNLNLIKCGELDFKYVKEGKIIVFKIDQDPPFSKFFRYSLILIGI